MHTMYLRRCAKCGALRREPRFLGFVKTEVELVCKVQSELVGFRNAKSPRGAQFTVRAVLACSIVRFLTGPLLGEDRFQRTSMKGKSQEHSAEPPVTPKSTPELRVRRKDHRCREDGCL